MDSPRALLDRPEHGGGGFDKCEELRRHAASAAFCNRDAADQNRRLGGRVHRSPTTVLDVATPRHRIDSSTHPLGGACVMLARPHDDERCK
jgi:hypothetical protein